MYNVLTALLMTNKAMVGLCAQATRLTHSGLSAGDAGPLDLVGGLWLAQSAPLAVWNAVWPYLMMILGFSAIVFIHELGHFAVAKWAGVRVERFAVGFGRELFGFTRGETRYSFNMLPLGGYVKMLGQEDFDDKSNEWKFKEDPRSFANKPVGHRMAIVSAGVVMNIVFAAFLFMIVFMIGMKAVAPRIAYVEPDSPAEKAGLLPGDVVKQINGEKVLEFNEVRFSVLLAQPHKPIEFTVERGGKLTNIYVEPENRRPDSSADVRRQVIGIGSGITPEIVAVGPEIDPNDPHQPHVGDTLVEIDGIAVTEENANEVLTMLASPGRKVFVERHDPEHPDDPPARVAVNIPPVLSLYPSDPRDPTTVSVLGLTPLVRVGSVDPRGRAWLGGIHVGDTVLMWDDRQLPTQADIIQSVRDSAGRDVPFKVLRSDGRIRQGFMRPKPVQHGAATIQASCANLVDSSADETHNDNADGNRNTTETVGGVTGLRARLRLVRPYGMAAAAGLADGDEVVSILGNEHPTCGTFRRVVSSNVDSPIDITVRKPDGSTLHTRLVPKAPGAIDAGFSLIADEILQTGAIVSVINNRPSAAAIAAIPAGATIKAVNDAPVSRWRELIAAFAAHAGTTVQLSYVTQDGERKAADFPVPRSIRTILGVGPAARIVRIDDKEWVTVKTPGGTERLSVRYHEGTRRALAELVGKRVPVEYRANALADLQTAEIDVTEDMVDPWLGRVVYTPNALLGEDTILLKGENALDAVWIGMHKTYYFIRQVYVTMERMFFTRSLGFENVSGPLGIIDMGGKVARAGLVKFLFFMAMISANLAVINFLPLPIVDGGLMVFLIIEKIKGSPVSLRIQVATQMIGLVLIIGVFLFVTFQDVARLFG